ncbi:lipase [Mycetocola tolaasinivorans]|uniref:Lipase n=1 Tax=Mycetocola tolaasinivorans TaxID=76635 RepID=A0A3L7ABZ9_9MICO|nr:SGNH/GDSL hydrolase family protein [Mycetocola tolaasinivorans]RLP77929.1 lipase [Mycetocola tolaasinivorans]
MTTPLTAVPLDATIIRGAAELEATERGLLPHRLPAAARAQNTDPQLSMVEAQPSGVRLAFTTTATVIEIDLFRSRTTFSGVPARPDGIVELTINGERVAEAATSGGSTITIDLATGTPSAETEPAAALRFDGLPAESKSVEIWLPHGEKIEIVELRTSAPVSPLTPGTRPVWVHHGSSISHGSNAIRPTGIWPVVAARTADLELVNLGFGGSALLDPFTARAIRDTPADLISLKLGINLVNLDLLRLRAFGPAVHGFLDTIRDGHPDTPLLVVSPIYCGIHEDTPGPGMFDLEALVQGTLRFAATGNPDEVRAGKLTLRVIRAELARIIGERQATDPNLFFLDGLELYGEADADTHPLPDSLHPGPESHEIMGERFARLALADGTDTWSVRG